MTEEERIECDRANHRKWNEQHKEERNAYQRRLYAERKAQGLCVMCGKPARAGFTYCFKCACCQSDYYRKYRAARHE